MPSKIITNKFNVYKTPFPANVLTKGEYIIGSSSPNGVLYTKMQNNIEYLFDEEDLKNYSIDIEYSSPIKLPIYKEIENHKE